MSGIEAIGDDAHETAWVAIVARDAAMDGAFVYAVRTTGVYCRPSCPARRPRRANVTLFALARQAREAGYRPCRRCRPDEISTAQRNALAVEAACRTIEARETPPTLAALATEAGLSPHHFHRIFRAHTGLTPRAYADAARGRRTLERLGEGGTVAHAAFGAGFASLSRFYDAAAARFAMAPSALARGGRGEVIVTAQATAPLGTVTAAFSRRGVTAIVLSDEAAGGIAEVTARFPHALLVEGGADFEALVAEVVAAIEEPARAAELPLDIRGPAFQGRVWAALRRVPVGTTATYGEIARAIGAPAAHRAVARACAANPLAVAIPCHRVVRADGSRGGYRWGTARKQALLAAEARAGGDKR